jgi:hypothetical protein
MVGLGSPGGLLHDTGERYHKSRHRLETGATMHDTFETGATMHDTFETGATRHDTFDE